VCSGNFATPWQLLSAVDAQLARYRLFMINAQRGLPEREGVSYETPFVGPGMRDAERLDYLPARLSLVPLLFRTARPPDVVLLHTSTPRRGRVSLGIEVNILPAALDAVRARGGVVLAQMNPQMPYTVGDAEVDLDDVDLAMEADTQLPSPTPLGSDSLGLRVAERVVPLVPDGATLQVGIGAVADRIPEQLPGHGYRVWSEMISDGILALVESGALDPSTPVVTSFAFGSQALYAWLDGNPAVRFLRTETTNDPSRIAAQQRMTSLNAALQVDLYGQANASRRGHHVHSGFGGQTDFVVGALHSAGGTAIVALPSWHPVADVSTVVPVLQVPVTSFQHGYIVSEQGAAAVWGSDQVTQARQIIDRVAHPSARDGLRAVGRELGLPV
jgi:acyl-CoA hydrolase